MVYPSLIPLDNFAKVIATPIGQNQIRFIAVDSGDYSASPGDCHDQIVYTVPAGKKAIVTEIYNVAYYETGSAGEPHSFDFNNTANTTFASIPFTIRAGITWGSVNYIQGFPITLLENDKIVFHFVCVSAAGFAIASALIEEKDK